MNRDIHRQIADQRGVDIRNPSTAFLGIDSGNRYATLDDAAYGTTTPYDINLTKNQNYLNGYFTRIALTEIRFPWAIPTITNRNDTMGLRVYNASFALVLDTTFVIPSGWYTLATLATAVRFQFLALAGNGADVTYQAAQHSYIGSITNSFSFYFYPIKYPGQPNRTGLYEMMNWNFPLVNINDPASFIGSATSVRSGVPTLLSTQYVDVVCNQLTYNQDVKDSSTALFSRDILCRLYLADGIEINSENIGANPFTIYRNFGFPKQIRWDPKQPVGQMLIQVYDDSGYLLTTNPANEIGLNTEDGTLPDYQFSLLATEV